ncbi:MAG TPA: methyltransferase domain-containing protein [Candidatus Binatia bacterium]|nr:methyltransferase domain-containing protein [Candidatus Binatia bacterium]
MSRSRTDRDAANAAYFDCWADRYDEGRIGPWFRYTQDLALDALDPRPESHVLDVGCGTGSAVLRLASLAPDIRVCGIDISARMIARARGKVPPAIADRVEFRRAAADAIPYADHTFDRLLCTNSFHHYPDPDRALGEMLRVLVPGGRLVILENAPDLSWYTWAWDRLLRITEKGHVRYYPSAELGALIRRAGFVGVELVHLANERFKHGKLFASIQLWRARTRAIGATG